MTYNPLPVTERILSLREQTKRSLVAGEADPYTDKEYRMFCTGDRLITLGFLEGWRKHKDAPTTKLRRSYAEAEELYAAKPVFYDGDLLCGRLYLPHFTPEEKERYDALCDAFESSPFPLHSSGARKDHIALDFQKLLSVGVEAVLNELYEKRRTIEENIEFFDGESATGAEFCTCCIVELEALLDLAGRYAAAAKDLSETAHGARREELLLMAAALENVPKKPAATFFEAVMSVHFFLSNLFGLYPLGRPDRYLAPFYERDIENGLLTRERAQELIDCLCLGISDRVFSRAACGFMVGGTTEDGEPFENELTYMFLTSLEHLRLADPNGALCVSEKTSDSLLRYAVEILAEGVTHPAFFNDDRIVSSLKRLGFSPRESVDYIHSTCAEITLSGCSRGHTTAVTIDLPRLLCETVFENPDLSEKETLLSLYGEKIRRALKNGLSGYEYKISEAARSGNEPMRICCFVGDCTDRLRGLYDGGVRYEFIQPIFVGFATAVDSIAAIEALCFDEKRLSLPDFCDIVRQNYEGNEPLRRYIVNRLSHYGNDDVRVDPIAAALAGILEKISFRKLSDRRFLIPGTFSYINHATRGAAMGATFDGRRANVSYSDGCCPVQGRDTSGPTAMIGSLTSWDQSNFLAGMVVNMKFEKRTFDEKKRGNLERLIHVFFARGGIELQINSVDRRTLEDALVHPENHRDLLVRIGGYSDYFVRLSPTLKQEIIERTPY